MLHAEVVLFTAGLEDYAKPIADELDCRYGNVFHHRLYRPATRTCSAYPCLKVGPPCQFLLLWFGLPGLFSSATAQSTMLHACLGSVGLVFSMPACLRRTCRGWAEI